VIYLDSSIALAHLFGEPRQGSASLWEQKLVSSQLLEYEVWNRIHARAATHVHQEARVLIGRMLLFELDVTRLARALDPFPIPVRTLDSLHLATIEYLRAQGNDVALASFDRRMIAGARALGIPLYQV
jgi:predicted nucleic acid-binding protein